MVVEEVVVVLPMTHQIRVLLTSDDLVLEEVVELVSLLVLVVEVVLVVLMVLV
jgi:hypothetical protein